MATWLQQLAGKAGSAINRVGQATGNRLPEFNLSENLQSWGGQPAQTAWRYIAPTPAYASSTPPQNNTSMYSTNRNPAPSGGSVLGQSTYNTGGGMPSNPVQQQQQQQQQQPYQQLQQGQDDGNAQIEADYGQAIALAGEAESNIRGQAGTAEGQITNEAAKTRTALGQEQATKEGAWNTTLSTAEKQGTSEMQQARDLFRQTQQGNIAQLSALGISSSSVAEALAEKLGVETARRIAGVTGDLNEVRLNVTKELGRIKGYFSEKMTQLQSDEQLQKQQIQSQLMGELSKINATKQQAASEKAARRADLLSQVNQQLYSLAQQKQQFEQQLQIWAQQKSSALTPLTTNEGLSQIVSNFQDTIKANPGINQYQIDARMPIRNEYGSGYITMSNKKKDEDPDGWNNGAPPAWLTAGSY